MAAVAVPVAKIVGRVLIGIPVLLVLPILFAVESVAKLESDYTKRILWMFAAANLEDLISVSQATGSSAHKLTVNRVDDDERIALTIDDAPGDDPEMMMRLLDLLRELQVSVTFFCTTNFIAKNSEMDKVMKQAVEDGHELANHMPEDKFYIWVEEEEFEEELVKSSIVLEEYTGMKPGLFRAPKGAINSTMTKVLEKHNLVHILGDVFSNDPWIGGDYDPPSTSCISFHVKYTVRRARAGSIIIFHSPNKDNRRQILPILEQVVPQLKQRGLKFDTVSNLLDSPTV